MYNLKRNSNMKKEYMSPAAELHRIEAEGMMALSIVQGSTADPEGEVLVKGEGDWNIWAGK